MLDHLTVGASSSVRTGAGSHEIATFNIHDPSSIAVGVGRGRARIIPYWTQGLHFQVKTSLSTGPHNVLPSPTVPETPRCGWLGNPPTFEKADGSASAPWASTSHPSTR